jgi:hypothetical protein
MTKRCKACREEKSLEEYRLNARTSKLIARCIPCEDDYKRKWHYNRGLDLKKFLFEFLSSSKCKDCGESDIMVLEFDHTEGKSFNLGKAHMVKKLTLEELAKEVSKCEVRCSNCHTRKTHEEQRTWRWQMHQVNLQKKIDNN